MFKWLVFFFYCLLWVPRSSSHRTSKTGQFVGPQIHHSRWACWPSLSAESQKFQIPERICRHSSPQKKEILILSAPKRRLVCPIYVNLHSPTSVRPKGQIVVDSLIQMVKGIAAAHPLTLPLPVAPQDVNASFAIGLVSLPMGMENGSPISTPADLEIFQNQALVTSPFTHSKSNAICDSSYDNP